MVPAEADDLVEEGMAQLEALRRRQEIQNTGRTQSGKCGGRLDHAESRMFESQARPPHMYGVRYQCDAIDFRAGELLPGVGRTLQGVEGLVFQPLHFGAEVFVE